MCAYDKHIQTHDTHNAYIRLLRLIFTVASRSRLSYTYFTSLFIFKRNGPSRLLSQAKPAENARAQSSQNKRDTIRAVVLARRCRLLAFVIISSGFCLRAAISDVLIKHMHTPHTYRRFGKNGDQRQTWLESGFISLWGLHRAARSLGLDMSYDFVNMKLYLFCPNVFRVKLFWIIIEHSRFSVLKYIRISVLSLHFFCFNLVYGHICLVLKITSLLASFLIYL